MLDHYANLWHNAVSMAQCGKVYRANMTVYNNISGSKNRPTVTSSGGFFAFKGYIKQHVRCSHLCHRLRTIQSITTCFTRKQKTAKAQLFTYIRHNLLSRYTVMLAGLISLSSCGHINDPTLNAIVDINYKINAYKYISDINNYKKPDHWATLSEFYSKGGGDCEDYANAKYEELIKAGIQQSSMSYILITTSKNETHAALAVDHNGQRYIMDNESTRVESLEYLKTYKSYTFINSKTWRSAWKKSSIL